MKTQVYTGKLKIQQRMKNSINGNPRYMLTVGDTVMYTAPDSMLAYQITNFDNKQVTVSAGMHYNKLTIQTVL